MSRIKIPPLSEERKRQIHANEIDLLTVEDLAEKLQFQPRTIKDWVRNKNEKYKLHTIARKIGGRFYFLRDDLLELSDPQKTLESNIDADLDKLVERSVR